MDWWLNEGRHNKFGWHHVPTPIHPRALFPVYSICQAGHRGLIALYCVVCLSIQLLSQRFSNSILEFFFCHFNHLFVWCMPSFTSVWKSEFLHVFPTSVLQFLRVCPNSSVVMRYQISAIRVNSFYPVHVPVIFFPACLFLFLHFTFLSIPDCEENIVSFSFKPCCCPEGVWWHPHHVPIRGGEYWFLMVLSLVTC